MVAVVSVATRDTPPIDMGRHSPFTPSHHPHDSPKSLYKMAEKHARLAAGGSNPFIDPAGYAKELDLAEAMFQAVPEQPITRPNSVCNISTTDCTPSAP